METHHTQDLVMRLLMVCTHMSPIAAALVMVCLVLTSCAGPKMPVQEPARKTVQPAAPAPERAYVPSWGYGQQIYVSGQPQFFAYLDRLNGDPRSVREAVIRDFAQREYAVVEERVLSGRSVTAVFKDLGMSSNIFVLVAEGETANLKYSISAIQTPVFWHYGLMYGFPVVVIKGPVTYFHHVNVGFAFFHDDDGASLDTVKQAVGQPVLKDGTKITILRLRPTVLGVPM